MTSFVTRAYNQTTLTGEREYVLRRRLELYIARGDEDGICRMSAQLLDTAFLGDRALTPDALSAEFNLRGFSSEESSTLVEKACGLLSASQSEKTR